MRKVALLVGWLCAGVALAVSGQPVAEGGGVPPMMPREREITLAESAAPPHIAQEATIYALERNGYVVARKGSNGFHCLVVRSFPTSQEPLCLDQEGAASILPRYLDAAALRAQGLSREQVRQKIAEGFLTGKYRAPRRAGISYMLSCDNRVPADEEGKRIIPYPPHVMFFAPNVTNQDLGANFKDRWLPFVIDEGGPHAYIIVPVGEDPSAPRCPKSTE